MNFGVSEAKKGELEHMAGVAVTRLIAENAGLQGKLNGAPGYMVLKSSSAKVPLMGGEGGIGIVKNSATGRTVYVKAAKLDIGDDLSIRDYKLLLLFKSGEDLKKALAGTWQLSEDNGYSVYVLTEEGKAATYKIDALKLKLLAE